MKFEFKPSFEQSLKALHPKDKEQVKAACFQAIEVLSQDRFIRKGIGLKRLRGDYWEVRHGLKTRLIFRWNKDLVEFILAGSHDDIRRFLKGI